MLSGVKTASRWLPWGLVLAAVAGCDAGRHRDPAKRFLLERAVADEPRVREAMAKGENPSPFCVSIQDAVRELPSEHRADLDRLCAVDAPVAWAGALVKRLERAGAGSSTIDDCFDLERALEWADARGADSGAVKGLHAKRKTLCP
jgi:hypothetical protein